MARLSKMSRQYRVQDADTGGVNEEERGRVMTNEVVRQSSEEDPYWGDGRMVFRRPEVRNSELEKSYIVHTAQELALIVQTLAATVMRRRALPPEELEAQLERLAAMEAEQQATPLEG
jgi:hypothetical protein